MKRFALVMAIILMVLMSQTIHAAPPLPYGGSITIGGANKYQLDITIRYNSLNSERISEVISEILKEHGKACKVELKVKKIDGEVIFFQSSDGITLTPMTQN